MIVQFVVPSKLGNQLCVRRSWTQINAFAAAFPQGQTAFSATQSVMPGNGLRAKQGLGDIIAMLAGRFGRQSGGPAHSVLRASHSVPGKIPASLKLISATFPAFALADRRALICALVNPGRRINSTGVFISFGASSCLFFSQPLSSLNSIFIRGNPSPPLPASASMPRCRLRPLATRNPPPPPAASQ